MPVAIKEDAEKLLEVQKVIDCSEIKHNLVDGMFYGPDFILCLVVQKMDCIHSRYALKQHVCLQERNMK